MYEEESHHSEFEFSFSFFLILISSLLVYIAFLGLLQRTLKCVGEKRRTISSFSVWIMLIPIVNIFYQFFLVSAIANSLRAELNFRKSYIKEDRPGYDLGLLMCLANIFSLFGIYYHLLAPVCLIFWIAYWVKIAGFRKQLGGPRNDFSDWEKTNKPSPEIKSSLEDFRDKL